MKFFECFLGQDANKTSCLLKVLTALPVETFLVRYPVCQFLKFILLEKKYNKISQFQGFKTVLRIIDEPPGSRWWQSLGWCFCGILDDWILPWLMVDGWEKLSNWKKLVPGFLKALSFFNMPLHHVHLHPKGSWNKVFLIEGIPGSSKFEFGGWWNLELYPELVWTGQFRWQEQPGITVSPATCSKSIWVAWFFLPGICKSFTFLGTWNLW